MTIKLKQWHLLDDLKTPEEIALYLEACLEEAGEDSEFITNAVYEIAKAKHLTEDWRDTGVEALAGSGRTPVFKYLPPLTG